MSTKSECKLGGETLANGNCTVPGPDGLPVQCVGAWAADKHYYLQKYIEATRAVRANYLPPKGQGGAAFIDLFAGPGRARERRTGEIQDGSPMVALEHAAAPFKAQLSKLGYLSQQVRSQPIKNSQNVPLYYLVYASKSDRGDKIWQSITKNAPSGQRGFPF